MVIAAMASTIGTARGNTHGSWRPLAFNVVSMPSILTVSCSISTVATGLNATRKKISCPLLIPLGFLRSGWFVFLSAHYCCRTHRFALILFV